MTHETIYNQIIRYLEENGESWSGPMCRAIHEQSEHKEGIIERRARELEVAGKIHKVYAQVDGKGPRCVKYYLKKDRVSEAFDAMLGYPMEQLEKINLNPMQTFRPDFLKEKLIKESQPGLL